ncbi:VOC family protein [Embleya sp. NBC_00896]|uniref:VOC family protein n=1 Tax=Embleya sp. NBC_00896 TaxID=2975961 RepID=UPI002F916A90|nr:VOC family protein [Embleya sp. NBC_00896]
MANVESVKPIPDGYPQLTPYLCVDGAGAAIAFYTEIFGATERMRMGGPEGKIGHAEFTIGNALIMISDEYPEMSALAPKSVGGTPVTMHLYVDDVDATYNRAVAAGATVVQPLADQFYGDRSGCFEDPFGHRWNVATHVEDVPPEEIRRRAAEKGG